MVCARLLAQRARDPYILHSHLPPLPPTPPPPPRFMPIGHTFASEVQALLIKNGSNINGTSDSLHQIYVTGALSEKSHIVYQEYYDTTLSTVISACSGLLSLM